MLSRLRLGLLIIAATVPIVIVWPPDPFDPYFGAKAIVVVAVGVSLFAWWSVASAWGFVRVRRLGFVATLSLALSCSW